MDRRVDALLWRAALLVVILGVAPAAHATVIGFDQDAGGVDIPDLEVIDDEYATIGVHFSGGFRAGRRGTRFPTYTANSSLNYLCTTVGATTPNIVGCVPPGSGALVVQFDFDVSFVSLEGYTRNDGPFDGDQLLMTAFDVDGNALASTQALCNNNPPPHTTEGVCVAAVSAVGIRRVVINPSDQDALDTLTFEVPEGPAVPEPASLVLLGSGLVAAGLGRGRRRSRR